MQARGEAVDDADTPVALVSREFQVRVSLHHHGAIGRLVPDQLAVHQPTHRTRLLHLEGLVQAGAAEGMAAPLQGGLLHNIPHADGADVVGVCVAPGRHAGLQVLTVAHLMEHDARLLVRGPPEPLLLLPLRAPGLGGRRHQETTLPTVGLQDADAGQQVQVPFPLGPAVQLAHLFTGAATQVNKGFAGLVGDGPVCETPRGGAPGAIHRLQPHGAAAPPLTPPDDACAHALLVLEVNEPRPPGSGQVVPHRLRHQHLITTLASTHTHLIR